MVRLVGVELARLRWRRAVVMLLVAAFVVPAVIALFLLWNTRPVSDDAREAARDNAAGEIAACEQRPRQFGLRKASADECADTIVGWYTEREPLSLANERSSGTGLGVVTALMLLLLLAGTTFVGHDWHTGSMSNQLLFEPRRSRIWAAKALAVVLVSAVTAAVVSAAYWLTLWAVARARDLPASTTDLVDCLQLGLRGTLVAAGAALGGYVLTMLLRSTVATLGALFAVSVLGGLLIAVAGIDGRWQPQVNLEAVVLNGADYYVDVPESCYSSPRPQPQAEPAPECDQLRRVTGTEGAAYLGGLLVVIGVPSLLSFRRRDVP